MTAPLPQSQPSIVERLREAAAPRSKFGILPTRSLYGDAADRIEELESDVTRYLGIIADLYADAARAETAALPQSRDVARG